MLRGLAHKTDVRQRRVGRSRRDADFRLCMPLSGFISSSNKTLTQPCLISNVLECNLSAVEEKDIRPEQVGTTY